MLRDDDPGAAPVEVGDNGVAIEGLVAEQGGELDTLDQRGDADRVEPVAGQKDEADQVPSASVSARILVVMPPLERPMARL